MRHRGPGPRAAGGGSPPRPCGGSSASSRPEHPPARARRLRGSGHSRRARGVGRQIRFARRAHVRAVTPCKRSPSGPSQGRKNLTRRPAAQCRTRGIPGSRLLKRRPHRPRVGGPKSCAYSCARCTRSGAAGRREPRLPWRPAARGPRPSRGPAARSHAVMVAVRGGRGPPVRPAHSMLANREGPRGRLSCSVSCCQESPAASPGPPLSVHVQASRMLRGRPACAEMRN